MSPSVWQSHKAIFSASPKTLSLRFDSALSYREVELLVSIYDVLCIHSPIEGHLGCFRFLVVTNKATINIFVQHFCAGIIFEFVWINVEHDCWIMWNHRLNGHEFQQTLIYREGQRTGMLQSVGLLSWKQLSE